MALHPVSFPNEGRTEANQSWEDGALESHPLLFQSLDPRRLIAATLWPSGYLWKESRNFFKSNDLTAKDPDKKSFRDLGQAVEARNELSAGAWTFLPALMPLP